MELHVSIYIASWHIIYPQRQIHLYHSIWQHNFSV
jgi:hypothetical protein